MVVLPAATIAVISCDIDVIFFCQRMSQVIDIGDNSFMHRFQRAADTGKNHSGDNIFAVTGLQIMTAFDTNDFPGFKIHKLNNHCRRADINCQTIMFIGCIATFYLQNPPDAIVPGKGNGNFPIMST